MSDKLAQKFESFLMYEFNDLAAEVLRLRKRSILNEMIFWNVLDALKSKGNTEIIEIINDAIKNAIIDTEYTCAENHQIMHSIIAKGGPSQILLDIYKYKEHERLLSLRETQELEASELSELYKQAIYETHLYDLWCESNDYSNTPFHDLKYGPWDQRGLEEEPEENEEENLN